MELQVQAKWCRLAKRNHEHLIIVGFIVWIVYYMLTTVSSVQFSRSVVSDSLWHHGLQHTKLLCPFLSPGICSNFCPLSWWFYLTILSSAIPFSSCLQSFPASGSFLNNSLFTSDGQSIGVSASAFSIMDGKTVSILLRCFLKRIYRCWSLEAIQKETRRKVIRNATGDMDRAATLSFQSCK